MFYLQRPSAVHYSPHSPFEYLTSSSATRVYKYTPYHNEDAPTDIVSNIAIRCRLYCYCAPCESFLLLPLRTNKIWLGDQRRRVVVSVSRSNSVIVLSSVSSLNREYELAVSIFSATSTCPSSRSRDTPSQHLVAEQLHRRLYLCYLLCRPL